MPDLEFPIVTKRLYLRPLSAADIDAVHAYHQLEDVARFQFWEVRSRAEVAQKIAKWALETGKGDPPGDIVLAVVRTDNDQLIGDAFLGFRDHDARQGEVGFSFHPDAQGNGYASEAVRALFEIGFNTFNLHRISGRCDARNTASWRLMERLGMRREAHFREHALFKGEWDEEFYYAILEDEWRAKSGASA